MSSFQETFDRMYDFGCVSKETSKSLKFKVWIYEQGFEKMSEQFDLVKINKGNERELRRILKEHYNDIIDFFTEEPFEISFDGYSMKINGEHVNVNTLINRIFYNRNGLQTLEKFLVENLEKIDDYNRFFYALFTNGSLRFDETDRFIRILYRSSWNIKLFREKYNMSEAKYRLFAATLDEFMKVASVSNEKNVIFDELCKELKQQKPTRWEDCRYASEQFLKKYGGTISGSAALAFYTGEFIPNDVDVYFTDADQYEKAKKELSYTRQISEYKYGSTHIRDISYNMFMGVEFNLILVDKIHKFDMECCRLIWDPTLEDPFSRSNVCDLLAVEYKIITYPIQALLREKPDTVNRLRKYIDRGMRIILVDNPLMA